MAEDEEKKISGRCVAGTFYAFICVAFTIYLIVMLVTKPLFPFRSDSAEWSSSWLLLAVFDYYHMAVCFVGIVIATENRISGIIWSLLVLILGAPFACLYTAKQIGIAGTLKLRENYMFVEAIYQTNTGSTSGNSHSKAEKPLAGFVGYLVAASYVFIGGAFGARLGWTIFNYPLTTIASDDAEWSFEWFITTLLDYYTIAACVAGIVLSTEDFCPGSAWFVGMGVITGPAGSAWMAQRLFRQRPLTLESA